MSASRFALAALFACLVLVFACQGDDDARCVPSPSLPIDPSKVIGTLRIADDERPWTVQRRQLRPHCGGQTDYPLHVITIADHLERSLAFPAAVHEVGHAIGITQHLSDPSAVMFWDSHAETAGDELRAAFARSAVEWSVIARPEKRVTFDASTRDDPLFSSADKLECRRVEVCAEVDASEGDSANGR